MEISREDLLRKFDNLERNLIPHVVKKMKLAAGIVETQAKWNCTPGKSPYDWMIFPSKRGASGAPYSVDKNPKREAEHMREEMYSLVDVVGKSVYGIIGNTKDYALPVHDGVHAGGRYMPARPFILDALIEKDPTTSALLAEALVENCMEQCV